MTSPSLLDDSGDVLAPEAPLSDTEHHEVRPTWRGSKIPDAAGRMRFEVPFAGRAAALAHAAELYAAGYHVNVRDARGWLVCTGQRAASMLPSAVAAK